MGKHTSSQIDKETPHRHIDKGKELKNKHKSLSAAKYTLCLKFRWTIFK